MRWAHGAVFIVLYDILVNATTGLARYSEDNCCFYLLFKHSGHFLEGRIYSVMYREIVFPPSVVSPSRRLIES